MEKQMKSYLAVTLDKVPELEVPAFLSLQAIMNAHSPELYLIPKEKGPEKFWMNHYRNYGFIPETKSPETLLEEYLPAASGYIVFDPECPESINYAITLAGIKNSIVCPPSMAAFFSRKGLECHSDLTGKFADRVDSARATLSELIHQSNRNLYACYDQGKDYRIWPTMDYLIAENGFCMGMSVNDADYPEESALWDQALSAAPAGSFMIGWHTARDGEASHVAFCSRKNVFAYCAMAWNISFHRYIQAKSAYSQNHLENVQRRPDKQYVTITLSDGDSWHSMCDVQKKFWEHPLRGKVPLGWEVAPIFAEIAPAVLEYYFQSKTPNDYLVCGPSGIAYNYLSEFPDRKLFLRETSRIMSKTSLKTIWTINRSVRHKPGGVMEHRLRNKTMDYTRREMEEFGGVKDQNGADLLDPGIIRDYIKNLPSSPGFFQGWERLPGEVARYFSGKGWFPTSALVRKDIDGVMKEIRESAEQTHRPSFIATHVNCYDADMETIIELSERLAEEKFKLVRPDEFLALSRNALEQGLISRFQ